MGDETDYLRVLEALDDIPFNVGRKLLTDYLRGNESNESIRKNSLCDRPSFGSLAYDEDEIIRIIEKLVRHDLIRYTTINGKKFWRVLELTEKGKMELDSPQICVRFKGIFSRGSQSGMHFNDKLSSLISPVDDEDRKLLSAFGSVLEGFNDEQKKAIASDYKNILCIAGAGSGKTTVLTNRVGFLINFRSIDPKKILAITFTRKARAEMMQRLSSMHNAAEVEIHTFNSFCENILRKHNDLIYDTKVRVLEYRDKTSITNRALAKAGKDIERATYIYFTAAQRRMKTPEQLANIFMNDCFFLRDYMKLKSCDIDSLKPDTDAAKLVFGVCSFIESYMYRNGLRDFADQLIDTISLFRLHPELIPNYSHILIDEYQDVNSVQIKLIDMLKPGNIFAVGDPRQSIYGWRGSDIRYLLKFNEKYPDCQLLALTENYRSTEKIVRLINAGISYMHLSDLKSAVSPNDSPKDKPGHSALPDIRLLRFDNEDAEFEFVIQGILSSGTPRNDIFVLARTNRQLVELSELMHIRDIPHVLRSDELRKTAEAGGGDVTLATIHAIKGLEAEMVFVIGCTPNNFPCKGSEHPVTEMVELEEYNKDDEERRLFYVAMSRAKSILYLSYSGTKHTHYITDDMLALIEGKSRGKASESRFSDGGMKNRYGLNKNIKGGSDPIPGLGKPYTNHAIDDPLILTPAKRSASSAKLIARLKEWRLETSRREGKAPYSILHDPALFSIAERMPITQQELERIDGVGPVKAAKYGEELLDVINGY